MSSFRCPYYRYDGGHYICLRLDNSKWNYLSSLDFEKYCSNESNYRSCPYYR